MLGLRLLIVVLLLLRLGVRSGGGFRIGLGLGLGLRLLVGLLLRRDGIVHRLGCLGYRGLVLGFDGLGQFLARLVILHVAVAGLQQGFRRVDGLRQLRVVHRVHRLLQAPGVLLVPCGRIVQFVDRRFKPVLAVGHAALVFRRFHVQRGFQRVEGLRVLHLIGLDLQQVGRVAVDERVPVVHRAARRVGGRGARGLRLGQSAVRPYFPSDAAGHHKRQRAQARDQGQQPLRTLPSILAWLCDVLGGCFDGFEDFRLVVLVHHCSPCIDNALLICRDTRVGLQRFPRDVE